MEITQALVRELFNYREDGFLIAKTRVGRRKENSVVSVMNVKGYYVTRINKRTYGAHRIIFLWHHGYLPPEVDHIDLNRGNNRIDNLRSATTQENQRNTRARRNNSSGFKGVVYEKDRGTWRALICLDRKKIHLGRFSTPEAAHAAYKKAADKHHGEFARAA